MNFLPKLRNQIEAMLAPEQKQEVERARGVQLAVAALMLEIGLADGEQSDAELQVIKGLLGRHFSLAGEELADLVAAAHELHEDAVSMYEFTRMVNEKLMHEERVAVIGQLWQVAYADRVLDKYEEHFIRKFADLLYVSHADYIKTKIAAQTSGTECAAAGKE
ncbi:MAG: tellurite resistance TerB family protein [Candidatus Eutrophobiaceae bacterium]